MDRYNELTGFQKLIGNILVIVGFLFIVAGIFALIGSVVNGKEQIMALSIYLLLTALFLFILNEIYLAILKIEINTRKRNEEK